MNDPRYDRTDVAVAELATETRARFIARTYGHLLGAIAAFVLLEVFLFKSGLADSIMHALSGMSLLLFVGAFLIVGWLATHLAHTARSLPAQYLGLAGYVILQALIFVPMLSFAQAYSLKATGGTGGIIQPAALVTILGFTGLSGVVFMTRQDFSFLGGLLKFAMVVAFLTIVAGAIFGFNLGTFFSVAMIGLAGGAILYDTSNVLHHYPEDRYVSASLQLFASVALMFMYVLRLFMSRD